VASRTITLLQDDIDGSDATKTVRFAMTAPNTRLTYPTAMPTGFGKALPSSSAIPAR
jgi:hypothetical protein